MYVDVSIIDLENYRMNTSQGHSNSFINLNASLTHDGKHLMTDGCFWAADFQDILWDFQEWAKNSFQGIPNEIFSLDIFSQSFISIGNMGIAESFVLFQID